MIQPVQILKETNRGRERDTYRMDTNMNEHKLIQLHDISCTLCCWHRLAFTTENLCVRILILMDQNESIKHKA